MLLSLLYVLLSGIALPVGGIQMQYLWRNQLGDVYSLGLGSAACLGAAAATMSGWCSLTVGSFICTLICTIICFFVTLKVNTQQLITFGILFGTFIGSLGTIVVTNAPTGDHLKQYYLWGAANFRLEGVTTGDILFSLVLFAVGFGVARLHLPRCPQPEPPHLQEKGHPGALLDQQCHGRGPAADHLPGGGVCKLRHLSSHQRHDGHHRLAAHGHDFCKKS